MRIGTLARIQQLCTRDKKTNWGLYQYICLNYPYLSLQSRQILVGKLMLFPIMQLKKDHEFINFVHGSL